MSSMGDEKVNLSDRFLTIFGEQTNHIITFSDKAFDDYKFRSVSLDNYNEDVIENDEYYSIL